MPGCYEDLEEADLVVLVGSNTAWCHPVLYQRLMAARETRGTQDRRDRSAPHRDRARPPICICRWRPAPTSRCSTACWPIWPTRGALDRDWIARTRIGLRRRARGGAAIGAVDRDGRRRLRTRRRDAATPSTICSPRTERVVTLYSQGVNQSVGRHRQGQRHHQLPSRDRPHRPARHGAVLAHRPAQRDGRARGRRPRQPARRAYGLRRPDDIDRVRRFWNAPRHRDEARPQGGRPVRRRRGRPHQGGLDHRPPIRPTACRAPDACARRWPTARSSSSPTAWPTDTTALRPCRAARRRPGARRTARSPIPSAHLAPARVPRRARRGAARLVDVRARSARRMGWADAFAYGRPGRRSSANTPRCRRSRTTARRVFDIGALAELDDAAYDALAPVQWPLPGRARRRRRARLFADGGFPTPDGRARMLPLAPRRRRAGTASDPLPLNTGRVRDQWHTMTRTGRVPHLMTHTAEPLARAASARRGARAGSRTADSRGSKVAHGSAVLRVDASTPRARRARCSRRCTGPTSSPRPGPSTGWCTP